MLLQSEHGAFRMRCLIMPFYVPAFLAATGGAFILPVLPLYATALGANLAGVGAVAGAVGFGALLCNVPAGLAVTRFGKKRVIIGALALEVAASFAAGFAPSVVVLAACMFAIGASHSFLSIARLSFFRMVVPDSHRARALALLGGEYRFGSFIGPVAGGFLAAALGYGATFIAFSAFSLAVLLLSVFFVPADPPSSLDDAVPPRSGTIAAKGLRRVVSIFVENRKIFVTAGASIVLLQLVRSGRQVLIPLWGAAIGAEVETIGIILGLMYFVEMGLVYPAGVIMDRWGRRKAAIPCILLLSLGLALLPLARTVVLLAVVAMISAVGNGLGAGINMIMSTDYAPAKNPGEFIGVWRLIVEAGSAAGPTAVGAIAAVSSLGASSLMIAAFGLVGAIIMKRFVREPRQHRAAGS